MRDCAFGLSPLPGLVWFRLLSHGLRHGLYSLAAWRLLQLFADARVNGRVGCRRRRGGPRFYESVWRYTRYLSSDLCTKYLSGEVRNWVEWNSDVIRRALVLAGLFLCKCKSFHTVAWTRIGVCWDPRIPPVGSGVLEPEGILPRSAIQ